MFLKLLIPMFFIAIFYSHVIASEIRCDVMIVESASGFSDDELSSPLDPGQQLTSLAMGHRRVVYVSSFEMRETSGNKREAVFELDSKGNQVELKDVGKIGVSYRNLETVDFDAVVDGSGFKAPAKAVSCDMTIAYLPHQSVIDMGSYAVVKERRDPVCVKNIEISVNNRYFIKGSSYVGVDYVALDSSTMTIVRFYQSQPQARKAGTR